MKSLCFHAQNWQFAPAKRANCLRRQNFDGNPSEKIVGMETFIILRNNWPKCILSFSLPKIPLSKCVYGKCQMNCVCSERSVGGRRGGRASSQNVSQHRFGQIRKIQMNNVIQSQPNLFDWHIFIHIECAAICHRILIFFSFFSFPFVCVFENDFHFSPLINLSDSRSFRWKFNNSGETIDVGKERHYRNGSTSVLQYTPVTDQVSVLSF